MVSVLSAIVLVINVGIILRFEGAANEMLLDVKHKIVMSFTPKSACTKMVEMFWNQMGLFRGEYYPFYSFIHEYRPKFYEEYGRVTDAILMDPSYYKFKVVRNPWDRAVSSYNHIMVTGQGKYLFSHSAMHRIYRERNLQFPSAKEGFSFEDYLTLYSNLKDWNSYEREDLYDQTLMHVEPHVIALELEKWKVGIPLFNRIVKLENFEDDIARVNRDTGLNYSYPVGADNHNARRHKEIEGYVGNVPWNRLKHRVPSDYAQYYNNVTKELVARLFEVDITVYGYSYPFDRVY